MAPLYLLVDDPGKVYLNRLAGLWLFGCTTIESVLLVERASAVWINN